MRQSTLYRSDLKEAVRAFRPVLRSLKIRSSADHPIVFIAAFDCLSHLRLETWTIRVVIAEMKVQGMFFIKETAQGSLRAYIVLNKMLYENPKLEMKELLKTAGVHEFVHFMAHVYAVTVTDTQGLRECLLSRLAGKIMRLPGKELLTLYNGLFEPTFGEVPTPDTHFRLGYEGETPDYYLLFLHFMFSRELFEEYFDKEKQRQFKEIFQTDEGKAIYLLLESLRTAAADKDVPLALANSQLMEWAHVYVRKDNVDVH